MDMGDWIKDARSSKGWSQDGLGKVIGCSKANVSHWETGKHTPSLQQLHDISVATGFPLPPLGAAPTASHVSSLPAPGYAPLITWEEAAEMGDATHQPGTGTKQLPCPIAHGPRTFCLEVRGESMNNPAGRPSYSSGDVIFVDPDRTPNSTDRVIVALEGQAEATFKQLVVEDGRNVLAALNPAWSPRFVEIPDTAKICGVVIGKWVPA
ncbi:LexA family protein [Hydrogenophaga defluvii]